MENKKHFDDPVNLFLFTVVFTHVFLSIPSLGFNSSLMLESSKRYTFIAVVDPNAKPYPFQFHKHWYTSLISVTSPSSSFLHVYKTLLHGFSANLTSAQAKHIENSHGVLAIFKDSVLQLHTTRSPAFLGLDRMETWMPESAESENVIVGIIDTGIWPEHESLSDKGLGSVPGRWKGQCEEGTKFNGSNCNKKLIGARYFLGGYEAAFGRFGHFTHEFRSPRDSDGHGTHVASLAAGAPIHHAGFFGFGAGSASGMAPRARISVYKVCWAFGCLLSDVCAAFDKAIADGVDIISYSLGLSKLPFYLDLLAIITFRAVNRGVFVVASAGNDGPSPQSIMNEPPWIMTVGAGTIDRDFSALITLGNGKLISGQSISFPTRSNISQNPYPLYNLDSTQSSISTISSNMVRGKIVLCTLKRRVSRLLLGAKLKAAGAAAAIISHGHIDPEGLISEPHVIPTISIGISEARAIEKYILSNENPLATVTSQGTISMHAKPAPIVASFSSRGPNSIVPRVLKPDIIAPGVNILGAWTTTNGPSGLRSDNRRSRFNIMSGTSMACPHVSGVSALIKSVHPNWGPGDMKSALMTTSTTHKVYVPKKVPHQIKSSLSILDESSNKRANPFHIGAGHLQPRQAMDPGLVYDLGYQDYVNFLCNLNYTKKQIEIVTGRRDVICLEQNSGNDLNYPGIVLEEEELDKGDVTLYRRLKKVDEGAGEYKAKVMGDQGFYEVDVKPRNLRFSRLGKRLRFRVHIKKGELKNKKIWFGALIWREERGKARVIRCPIVVFSGSQMVSNFS